MQSVESVVVAIAGCDPAVLEIWDMQVSPLSAPYSFEVFLLLTHIGWVQHSLMFGQAAISQFDWQDVPLRFTVQAEGAACSSNLLKSSLLL